MDVVLLLMRGHGNTHRVTALSLDHYWGGHLHGLLLQVLFSRIKIGHIPLHPSRGLFRGCGGSVGGFQDVGVQVLDLYHDT